MTNLSKEATSGTDQTEFGGCLVPNVIPKYEDVCNCLQFSMPSC